MKKKLAIFVLSQFLLAGWADAQQAYFIDGYHGGIYGHYPVGQTAFIAQQIKAESQLEYQYRDRA
ncbi:hypothetical protein [Parabacteroides distasonis]|uniref:hypothetical protein n=1 Tax=Parabacteroides distasonis TaxID=823 RepID=UPI0021BD5BA5|nr:hypothetical protein [Parabacteroides distasonis]